MRLSLLPPSAVSTFPAVLHCLRATGMILAMFAISVQALASEVAMSESLENAPPATMMALTEDGEHLVAAHEDADAVTIWDVRTGGLVKRLASDRPTFVLCRGGSVYVANYDEGTISVYKAAGNWELVDQLDPGCRQLLYLSAPQGEHFDGTMLVIGADETKQQADPVFQVVAVDVEQDTHRKIVNCSGIMPFEFSYNGRMVLKQMPRSLEASVAATERFLRDGNSRRLGRLASYQPHLYQVRDSGFWFGGKYLFGGPAPQLLAGPLGKMVVPDQQRRLAYAFEDKELVAYQVENPPREVARLTCQPPSWLAGYVATNEHVRRDPRPQHYQGFREVELTKGADAYRYPTPLAISHGDRLYLYTLDPESGQLHRCETGAFEEVPPPPTDIANEEEATFQAVPLPDALTCMVMTPDGRHLVTAHEQGNVVCIWDVASGELLQKLACNSPRAMLIRAGKLFVASHGERKLHVFDIENSWRLVDQLDSGSERVQYLSAPQGRYFKNELLATCLTEESVEVILIDVRRDSHRKVRSEKYYESRRQPRVVHLDYTGRYVVEQGQFFDASPPGLSTTFDARHYMSDENAEPKRGIHEYTPFLMQCHAVPLWVGESGLYGGVTPGRLPGIESGGACIPDVTQQRIYRLGDGKLRGYVLNATAKPLGERPARAFGAQPGELLKIATHPGIVRQLDFRERSYFTNLAATIANRLILYVFDPETGRLLRSVTAPLDGQQASPALASGTRPDEFPQVWASGRLLEFLLSDGQRAGKFELLKGPPGIRIDEQGLLRWTPNADDVGEHDLKIRAEVDGKLAFHRFPVKIVSAEAVAAAGSLADVDDLGNHYLLPGDVHVAYAHTYQAVLLLNGTELRVLDSHGQSVRLRLELEEVYRQIYDRPEYLVALSENSIDLLSKDQGKLLKRIEIDADQVHDLVIHPNRKISYVALASANVESAIEKHRVLQIDEKAGTAELVPNLFAKQLAIDPAGQYLHTAFNGTYRQGMLVDWARGNVLIAYGHFDVVLTYDISGDRPVFYKGINDPGADGVRLKVSPNGKFVTYISVDGYRDTNLNRQSYGLPVFAASDVSRLHTVFPAGGLTKDAAFHPTIDLVGVVGVSGLRVFHATTGEDLTERFDTKEVDFKQADKVMFSPGGRHMLVAYQGAQRARYLRAIPLDLEPEEIKAIGNGAKRPGPAVAPSQPDHVAKAPEVTDKAPLQALEAIVGAKGNKKLTSREIGRQYMDSVVLVSSISGNGSGFVIGSEGYILTCAHVLPRFGDAVVTYRRRQGEKVETRQAAAAVICADRENDLALLKIAPDEKLPPVRLQVHGIQEAGETITAIGHPGLGEKTLNYTMTTGIVSNPHQKVDGRHYLQTDAAVNPGSSGGPVFDSHGNVVGVIVLKGNIERAGFAVPTDRIVEFLKTCVERKD